MQLGYKKRFWRWIAGAALGTVLLVALWRPLADVLALSLCAAALCFVASPLEKLLERRLPRPAACLVSLVGIALAVLGVLWLLLPAIVREIVDLAAVLPASVGRAADWLGGARDWLAARLPGIALPELDLSALQGALAGLAGGTIGFAVDLAGVAGRASMAVVLAYFLLRDRDAILLRLELFLPQKHRATAIRMGNAACRELRLYLEGQLLIAGAVAALASIALAIVGVRSALVLGLLIGLLNMIPYFGPFIGGVPAVLIALTDGWQRAALTVAALVIVQQIDGSWISPRVMGSVTGFSPGLVLLGIYAGERVGGIPGMVLSLPAMMVSRTLFRVFVQKCENN